MKVDLYFDGNVVKHGTKDACGTASYLLIDKDRGNQKRETIPLGKVTNNEAEYMGLITGLEKLKQQARSRIQLMIYGDSQLVINQITRKWQTKHPQLRIHRDKVLDILSQFEHWEAVWVN